MHVDELFRRKVQLGNQIHFVKSLRVSSRVDSFRSNLSKFDFSVLTDNFLFFVMQLYRNVEKLLFTIYIQWLVLRSLTLCSYALSITLPCLVLLRLMLLRLKYYAPLPCAWLSILPWGPLS